MDVKGKKVLVVGAGKSGLAVSRFLSGRGATVILADAGRPVYPGGELEQIQATGVVLNFGGYPEVKQGSFDLVVMSPGVPLTVEPAVAAIASGVALTGELELAYHFARAPVVAITGTNGKTTTTTLVGEIFKNYGRDTLVGGNIGLPLVTEVGRYAPGDLIVAEVSSFQLETVSTFKPKVAVILNITPDHLDRHVTMDSYIAAKTRIFSNQGPGDYTVLNYDDPLTKSLGKGSRGRVIYFSRRREMQSGVFVREGKIMASLNGIPETVCEAAEIGIPGAHNLENALAAVAVAKVMGVETACLAHTLKSFRGVPHRLEYVAEINGVRYINDSKGTNPDAAIKAIEAYTGPVALIAGGKNKGSDFSAFAAKVKERAKVLILFGQCADLIAKAANDAGFRNILRVDNLGEAVLTAHRVARPGDTVLLSPACASWDMFNNFEERGDLFKEIVMSLKT